MNKKLTIGQIKKLPIPKTGYQEYSAGSVPGLRIRVMASGIRSFVFRYKYSGKNNAITLGRVEGLELKEAEQQAKVLRFQVDQGHDPAHERRETKRTSTVLDRESDLNPLFRDFVKQEFIPKHAKRHTKTWAETERYFDRDILPVLGKLRVKEITRRDVVKVLNIIQDRGAYFVSNRVRAAMSKAFTFAIQQGLLEANPVQYTACMKEKARERVLTEDEIRFLWAHTDDHISKLALRFALLSGQRAGEVAGMKWEHIKDGVWHLQDTKNGHSHTLPISTGMQGVLDAVRDMQGAKFSSNGFVFTSRKRDGSPIQRASMMAVMRSFPWGDDTPRVHDLRRTAATVISRLGHNRIVQDKVLNHVDASIGGIYDRNDYMPEKRQALEDLWAEVRRIVFGAEVLAFPRAVTPKAGQAGR